MVNNIVVIGWGYWGKILTKYLLTDKRFRVGAPVNSSTDLTRIFADDSVGSVVVATPEETHYEIAKQALLANKNVFVEKPLAFTEAECLDLKYLAIAKEKALVVDYIWTFSPTIQHIHYLIMSSSFGYIHNMKLSMVRSYSSKNIHWLLTCHLLSIIEWFIGLDNLVFSLRSDGSIVFEDGVNLYGVISVKYGESKFTEVRVRGVGGEHELLVFQPEEGFYLDNQLQHTNESNNLKYAFDCFYSKLDRTPTYRLDSAIAVTKVLERLNVSC